MGGPGPFAADGRPRFGYNGTSSPNYSTPPAALPGAGQDMRNDRTQSGTARNQTPSTKPPRIVRDPRNTTVNIDPPSASGNPSPSPSPEPAPSVTDTPPANTGGNSSPPAAAKPSSREDLPYGTPVVSKRGFVYSPHAEDKGYVDVEGLKRGTRVKCPYTGKHFRVP
jgi:hypothetical protein